MPPSISVLIPCRDAEAFLPHAIRSMQLQTYEDFEVVAVDDGSIDATPAILERWAERDRRVRVLGPGRLGLAEALRLGAESCRGRWIARFDADDIAHPRRLERQLEFVEHHGLHAAGTAVRYFPSLEVGWGARRYERWLRDLSSVDKLARDIFVECPIAHPTLMIRRNALEAVGGYTAHGWPEDYDLVLRLHTAGFRLANLPVLLHFWRERPDRTSRTNARFASSAFRRCKIEHLKRTHLADRRRVSVWGAGRVGKAFARALLDASLEVAAFHDIDPDKIGQRVYGIPVLEAGHLDRQGPYLLVAVGARGARALIRQILDQRGWREPRDYCCVA